MDFNIFGLSPLEIILIMAVALIVFGPDKLPQYARTAGKYVNQFRRMSQEVRTQVSRELTLSVKDEEGNDVGIQQYIVQVRDEVKGALSDVTRTITTETAAVKSAVTLDPSLFKNVISDSITTTVVANPDTPQAETLAAKIEPTSQTTLLNLPTNNGSETTTDFRPRPSRIHTLKLNESGSNLVNTINVNTNALANSDSANVSNTDDEIVREGMPFSEYEKTFGSYDIVDLGADAAADGGSAKSIISRKPRISKRGGYGGSRSRN